MGKTTTEITIRLNQDNYIFLNQIAKQKNISINLVGAWLLDEGIANYRIGSLPLTKSKDNTAIVKNDIKTNTSNKIVNKQPSEKLCRRCGKFKPRDQFSDNNVFCDECLGQTIKKNVSKVNLKKCTKCGQNKSIDNFYKKKDSIDGHHTYCKQCMSKYLKERRSNKKRSKSRKIKRPIKKSNTIIKESSNWKRNAILEQIDREKNKVQMKSLAEY